MKVKPIPPKWERIYKWTGVMCVFAFGCIGLLFNYIMDGVLFSAIFAFALWGLIGWYLRGMVFAFLYIICTKDGKEAYREAEREKAEEQRRKMEARRIERELRRNSPKWWRDPFTGEEHWEY